MAVKWEYSGSILSLNNFQNFQWHFTWIWVFCYKALWPEAKHTIAFNKILPIPLAWMLPLPGAIIAYPKPQSALEVSVNRLEVFSSSWLLFIHLGYFSKTVATYSPSWNIYLTTSASFSKTCTPFWNIWTFQAKTIWSYIFHITVACLSIKQWKLTE